MKHFKLFMMLALLVMGVSNVSAEKVWVDTQKTTWYDTELGLEFSTKYNRTGSSTEAAPNGGVAVRLYLGQTKQVTDTVSYEASWGGSVYNGANAQLTTTTNRTTNNVSDDDNDGAGTRANYKCLGRLDYHGYGAVNVTVTTDPEYTYFYERTHTIKYSERTSVVIPATAEDPDGNEHDVTAIQKWGMCYAKTAQNDLDYCSTNNVSAGGEPTHSTPVIVHNNINSHRNEYLAEVTFAEDCNIASIRFTRKELLHGKLYLLLSHLFCFWQGYGISGRQPGKTFWRYKGPDPLWRRKRGSFGPSGPGEGFSR